MTFDKTLKSEQPLVLLVDDQPENLHVLVAALKVEYRLKTAINGYEALGILQRRDDLPKLVVLDVNMPGISGLEVLNRLRTFDHAANIPVILLTSDETEETQLAGLNLGADDYLIKPVSPNTLLLRVRNQIQRYRDRVQLRLAAHVFEYSGEAMMITDRNNSIVDVNAAFTALTGYQKEEVLGLQPNFLASGQTSRETYRIMWDEVKKNGFWQGELWDKYKDGQVCPNMVTISVVRDREEKIDFHLASFVDISNLKDAYARIEHLAHHDSLTGLPNRLHLEVYLKETFNNAKRMSEQLALMLLDLDRFKEINDALGHSVGDHLLIQVAGRLKTCVRDYDFVARLGGDEFVVVLRGTEMQKVAALVANKINKELNVPFTINQHTLRTASSIGIAIYPDQAKQPEVLMKNADTAMYATKSDGGSGFRFFSSDMNSDAHEKMQLENLLHEAIECRQFELYYQPQFSLPDVRLIGAEVLLRWPHPERGFISPAMFIPLAEKTNQIHKIGEWVLEEACRQADAWANSGLPLKRLSLNVSAKQFQNKNLPALIRKALASNGFPRSELELELEITETAVMVSPSEVGMVLQTFRDSGILVALDDFGQGYSSLGQLKTLPLDRLKIDAAFVRDIGKDDGDKNNGAIAAATIGLAHSLGFKVIAEGVETEEQLAFLIAHGCDEVQGFYFSKPLNKVDFERLLRNQAD